MMGTATAELSGSMALAVFAMTAAAGQIPPLNRPETKAVALQAVAHMLLATDVDKLEKVFADEVAIDARDPRRRDVVLDEFRNELADLPSRNVGDLISVREIVFFDKDGIDDLKGRFPAKTDLWSPKQVPAYIEGGLGCYVVAKELRNGEEVDDEVYIFIVKEVGGQYRVVYFGNS